MNKSILREMNKVFDDDYKCKTDNINELLNCCNLITEQTKIQICTPKGQMYEYLPKVCKSVVKMSEV